MKDLKTLVNINAELILFSFILKGIAKSCFKTKVPEKVVWSPQYLM